MNRLLVRLCFSALVLMVVASAQAQPVTIPLSTVENPHNSADPRTGLGEVNHIYHIGTYDVTLAQYCAFLNAIAKADKYGLYSSGLAAAGNNSGLPTGAGIARTGSSGTYHYSVIAESGSCPACCISWLDAARFCNWLENREPGTGVEDAATTEDGSYVLNGDVNHGGVSGLEMEKKGSVWRLPTESEWYKAAYYDPTLLGGRGGYWIYPTRSDHVPGNVAGTGSNEANYQSQPGRMFAYLVLQGNKYDPRRNYLTPVGAFKNAASYYGTYDQGGNVWQWNQSIIFGKYRGLRGGSWYVMADCMKSDYTEGMEAPSEKGADIGFRVVEERSGSSISLPRSAVK